MSEKVLIVEDNRAINSLVGEILSAQDYACVSAYEGHDAIRLFDEEAPGAVVLDLNLPGLPGMEVLRHVKTKSPSTVVVILTGQGSERSAVQALKLGADDYLKKPVDGKDLVVGLAKNLTRARRERELEGVTQQWPGEVHDHWLGRLFLDAPSPLVHVDPTDTVRDANRAAAKLLGKAPESLLGMKLGEIAAEGIARNWAKVVRRDAATARGYRGELFLRHEGGMPIPAEVVAVERPEPGHLLLFLRDMTRQKALEEQFTQSKQLASLGRVVEGVAHEVRNPLISIGGFSRKLYRKAAEGGAERQYLGIIIKEVERLERMVEDIEDYVTFAGSSARSFASVRLDTILPEALADVRGRGLSNGVVKETYVQPDGELCVYGDRELLSELFTGLIENAYEAMPDGGALDVEVGRVDGWVRVRVADNGVGIDEADLQEIFDPFFTSKTAGAGLGLAKAYMIVEEHCGHIQFDSKLGEGTVCSVSLPMDRRQIVRTPKT